MRLVVVDSHKSQVLAVAPLVAMKRKLDANDVPSTEAPDAGNDKERSFEDLNLDPRLRQALAKEKFTKPTLVQAEAIPLALEGKDILGTSLFSL